MNKEVNPMSRLGYGVVLEYLLNGETKRTEVRVSRSVAGDFVKASEVAKNVIYQRYPQVQDVCYVSHYTVRYDFDDSGIEIIE